MLLNLVRSGGVPVFAYAASDASTLSPCSFMIQYCEPDEQATLSLRSSIHVRGCDDKQPFTLRFDANSISRGTISLPPTTVTSIPPERVDEIARQGNPQVRILSLTLKAPCSVWYPAALSSEPSIATTAHDFVTLSRATEVCVVFDRNWLRVGNFARLQRLVGNSVDWTGVPADDHFTKLFKQGDASIFKPNQDAVYASLHDAGPATLLDDVEEAPPSYASASNKRSWRARISLSPESPSSKRLLLEHAAAMYPGSPTERATSVSSPTQPFAPSMPKVDAQHEAVVNAVQSMLPDLLQTMLPDVLRTVLPGVLARLLAAPGSTPSPSPSPRPRAPLDLKSSPAATPDIRTLISGHVATHIQTLYDDAIDHAKEMHKAADMEFSEVLDDHRLDIGIAKNDAVAELERECHEKLVELKECATSVVEDVEAQADEVFNTVYSKLEDLGQEKKSSSRISHKPSLDRGRRAISLPL